MKYQYTKELLEIYHRQRRHYVVEQIVRGKTLKEAGEEVGITQARARQLLAKTMRLFDKSPLVAEFEQDGGEKPILEYEYEKLPISGEIINNTLVSKNLVEIARTNSKFYLTFLKVHEFLDDMAIRKIMFMDEEEA